MRDHQRLLDSNSSNELGLEEKINELGLNMVSYTQWFTTEYLLELQLEPKLKGKTLLHMYATFRFEEGLLFW